MEEGILLPDELATEYGKLQAEQTALAATMRTAMETYQQLRAENQESMEEFWAKVGVELGIEDLHHTPYAAKVDYVDGKREVRVVAMEPVAPQHGSHLDA